ncbi:MAG: sugar ABC transporter permease [Spirochaetes bacterium]|uniref:Sugar ABC transporter permease n=1 Tax=Candidatus Ornithospirochaeta stercoravium TaxID=2840897 RepID=A0A9D9NCD6_9SPIO|nr:sugar ABC transporter permease [Candidatus Ornithospirochaeta stercoravium]
MASTKALKKGGWHKRNRTGLYYVSIWLIGFALFQLYPFLTSLYYSFTDYSIFNSPKFIGFSNYVRLFTIDPDFMNSMKVTLQYTFITVPGKVILALLIALLLNKKLKGVNYVRTIYYIPSLLSGSVAVSILWKVLFMDDGFINSLLSAIHIPAVPWLGSTHTALLTICLLEIWQFGSSMVLFLSALKQVPVSLYEAALIDGAKKGTVFFKITFPMISSVAFFNIIMQLIQALQNFTSAFVVTNGGPSKATYVLGMKLYTDAFRNFNMGYACATSWIMFAMMLVMTLVLFATSKKWVYYDN